MDQKNEDISKSVSSIEAGAIFRDSSGHEVSRNVFVVFGYALWPEIISRTGFCMAPKNSDFHEIFEKVLAPASVPHFGRPCRGLRTLTGLRPQ